MLGGLPPHMVKESGLTMLTKRLYLALICVLGDLMTSGHAKYVGQMDTLLQKERNNLEGQFTPKSEIHISPPCI